MALDAAALLAPISEAEPCGEALDYDLDFLEFEILVQGKPEQQVGDAVVAGEPPDWAAVLRQAEGLGRRSKDLRIAVAATRAALFQDGFAGLEAGLTLLAGYIEDDWAGIHPRPDEDDPNDQTVRLNALANLCDPEGLLNDLRNAALATSRHAGEVSLRTWQDAQRSLADSSEDGAAAVSQIEAIFRETSPEDLETTAVALSGVQAALQRLDSTVRQHVTAEQALSFAALAQALEQAEKLIEMHRPQEASEAPGEAVVQHRSAGTGDIRDREDVVGMLDRICRWYRANEPGSPVPLLLERAKRLVAKDFLSLLLELAPEGAPQFRMLAGVSNDQE